MRNVKWMILLAAVLACGLIAAGCGGSDSTTSSTAADTSTGATTGDSSTTETTSGGGATADDVYNACLDVIKGTAAETAGQTACAQARDAFEQCASQAESTPEGSGRDLAIQACQDAADQATQALQAAG
jgi:hypothetical protein